MLRTVVASLSLFSLGPACGGATPPATTAPPPAVTPAPPPVVEAPPPTREEMIAAALARVPDIARAVATMRGLAVAEVPAAIQSPEAFRAFVESEAAASLEAPGAVDPAILSRALAAVGLLAVPTDLVDASVEAAVTQAAAYYDPKSKHFQVVVVPETDLEFDMVSAHELTHAIQDQHFDLQALMPATLSDDEANARRFLVEGEATVTMMAYLVAQAGKDALAPGKTGVLQRQIASFASLSSVEIGAMIGGDPAAMAAIASLPPYVLTPMFDSYMKGALAVLAVYIGGGWPAVDALYATPPASTEQMLHASTKLVCRREAPVPVIVPATAAGKGWTSLADGVAGELGVSIYGQVWQLPTPASLAAGWGGDRWRVFAKGDATLALWSTAWDSEADAAEFAAGMRASLATRKVDGDVRHKGAWVDVAIGCAGKACKAPLDAMAKAHGKASPIVAPLTADEAACVERLAPPATP
ncbi:MAG: hypothetical protein R2939_15550 [Kofleriaceae bacterium]